MAWQNGRSRTSTTDHKNWAAAVKRRAQGRCEMALPGCSGHADAADHIVPVAEGGAEFDVRNGQGACHSCHTVKTQQEAARGQARMLAKLKRPQAQHPGML